MWYANFKPFLPSFVAEIVIRVGLCQHSSLVALVFKFDSLLSFVEIVYGDIRQSLHILNASCSHIVIQLVMNAGIRFLTKGLLKDWIYNFF